MGRFDEAAAFEKEKHAEVGATPTAEVSNMQLGDNKQVRSCFAHPHLSWHHGTSSSASTDKVSACMVLLFPCTGS